MNTWKTNLEETKRHYIDWWNHRGIVLTMWEHFQEGVLPHANVDAPHPPRDLNQRWFDPEWRARQIDWYVAHSSLMADIMPVANTQLGPGSLAAILGGELEGGEDTIWIHPRRTVAGDATVGDDIRFDPTHPNWLLHKQLLQACKQRAQGHYYVGMPDLMEGLDVLAALFGTDQVLLDTVMNPERLERQLQQVNDIYFRVFDELYDIIREGDEMAFCYFSSWAPGKMTKLQSDISTMISQEDYRRFVEPFIREQCQRIDYTLYHLDGVGAMHHLDALLEIDELNAIQWTPGVGEPQGGSAKWYDLYKRILDHGKSVMACWVTLDELRPLLDHIGGDGVHIEMDFHNEREVEQAMRIVEEYQAHEETQQEARESIRLAAGENETDGLPMQHQEKARQPEQHQKEARQPITDQDRLLILDGGMGTMLQRYQLTEEDFRGCRLASHGCNLKGCNDVLSMTAPFIVRDIHRKYLTAGADIIETNTFNAQRISLADYGLESHAREINLAAARLARQCADEFGSAARPRYVAGSIGPTSKTFVGVEGNEQQASLAARIRQAYEEQIAALSDGGVDILLIETIFDVEVARIAVEAARKVAPGLPIMLSFAVATPDGHNMLGQDILRFLGDLTSPLFHSAGERLAPFSVGINCTADIAAMTPLVAQLARFGTRVSLYPNAGLPDSKGHYSKTPQALAKELWPLAEGHHLSIIGGCCGTTDEHIAVIAKSIEPIDGLRLSPLRIRRKQEEQLTNVADRRTDGGCSTPSPTPDHTSAMPAPETAAEALFQAVLLGRSDDAVAATQKAIAAGEDPKALINGQMIRAMSEVGRRFQEGKAFVPQLLMAGRAMKAALERLKPMLADTASTSMGKVLIGTVKGDLHDIGKNLVASMLEGCGFEVVNIGIDVTADTFVEEVRKNQPDILAMSALLTTTMGYMKEVIDRLKTAGLRDRVKVMVGGAPVTQGFADEIGADGYSDNANSAVTVAKQLLAG